MLNELYWHGHNCDLIGWLEFELVWKQNKFYRVLFVVVSSEQFMQRHTIIGHLPPALLCLKPNRENHYDGSHVLMLIRTSSTNDSTTMQRDISDIKLRLESNA